MFWCHHTHESRAQSQNKKYLVAALDYGIFEDNHGGQIGMFRFVKSCKSLLLIFKAYKTSAMGFCHLSVHFFKFLFFFFNDLNKVHVQNAVACLQCSLTAISVVPLGVHWNPLQLLWIQSDDSCCPPRLKKKRNIFSESQKGHISFNTWKLPTQS